LLRGESQRGIFGPIRHFYSPVLGRRSVLLAASRSGVALSSDFPSFRIHVAFPPIGSAFFGLKSAVDSGRSGGLEVQAMVLLVEGEPPNFFLVGVLKCTYDFGHETPGFHKALNDRLRGSVSVCEPPEQEATHSWCDNSLERISASERRLQDRLCAARGPRANHSSSKGICGDIRACI
jgi:hypothetical protein